MSAALPSVEPRRDDPETLLMYDSVGLVIKMLLADAVTLAKVQKFATTLKRVMGLVRSNDQNFGDGEDKEQIDGTKSDLNDLLKYDPIEVAHLASTMDAAKQSRLNNFAARLVEYVSVGIVEGNSILSLPIPVNCIEDDLCWIELVHDEWKAGTETRNLETLLGSPWYRTGRTSGPSSSIVGTFINAKARQNTGLEFYNELWNDMFRKLCVFKHIHGHCDVPINYEVNTVLPTWCLAQRALFRALIASRKLYLIDANRERFHQLKNVGFTFGPNLENSTKGSNPGSNFSLLSGASIRVPDVRPVQDQQLYLRDPTLIPSPTSQNPILLQRICGPHPTIPPNVMKEPQFTHSTATYWSPPSVTQNSPMRADKPQRGPSLYTYPAVSQNPTPGTIPGIASDRMSQKHGRHSGDSSGAFPLAPPVQPSSFRNEWSRDGSSSIHNRSKKRRSSPIPHNSVCSSDSFIFQEEREILEMMKNSRSTSSQEIQAKRQMECARRIRFSEIAHAQQQAVEMWARVQQQKLSGPVIKSKQQQEAADEKLAQKQEAKRRAKYLEAKRRARDQRKMKEAMEREQALQRKSSKTLCSPSRTQIVDLTT